MEINLEGIGPIFFERSNKAKNINISIKSSSQIRVAVPIGVSFEKAEEIARSKIPWIRKNLVKLSNRISLKDQFKLIDQDFAKIYLIDRLEYLANHYGFKYNKVSIRNQRTRWGSCSIKNNISLNIKLICLPKALIDYVILHELAHTKIKNHSTSFWRFLDQYSSNAKKTDKALKRYSCA